MTTRAKNSEIQGQSACLNEVSEDILQACRQIVETFSCRDSTPRLVRAMLYQGLILLAEPLMA